MTRDWKKRIALLLLLWAFLDICVPGVCRTDDIQLPPLRTGALFWQNARGTLPGHSTAQADQDDCFCCCSHIVHARYFVAEQSAFLVRAVFPPFDREPLEMSFAYFRPPRS